LISVLILLLKTGKINFLSLDNGKRKFFEWEPNSIERELLKMHNKRLKLQDSSYIGIKEARNTMRVNHKTFVTCR